MTGGWATVTPGISQKDLPLIDVTRAPYYADKTGAIDATAILEAAFTSAAAQGRIILIPKGTYSITPNKTSAWEGSGLMNYAFWFRSGLNISAEDGATFRIPDGISSDVMPKQMAMFFSNGITSGIRISGLTMDMNGQNNPISPSRPTTLSRYNQAQIHVTGTPNGVAARASDVFIERCVFKNAPGTSCVVAAQSNAVGAGLGSGWKIVDCSFEENGYDSGDHSSIYLWANDCIVERCRFKNSTMFNGTGGVAACELHGSDNHFIGNDVVNYFRGVWVASNRSNPCIRQRVQDNRFRVAFAGAEVYRAASVDTPVYDVSIDRNFITLTDDPVPGAFRPGIGINPLYAISNISITNNFIAKEGSTYACSGVQIGTQSNPGQDIDKVVVSNNIMTGLSLGIYARTTAPNKIGILQITDNKVYDPVGAGAYSIPVGISLNGVSAPIDNVTLSGNEIIDNRATKLLVHGIYVAGSIGSLNKSGNVSSGHLNAAYTEASASIALRRGGHEKVQITPLWSTSGGAVDLGNGTTSGRMTIDGDRVSVWQSMTIGSTTAIGPGSLRFTVPIAAAISGISYMGRWRIFDASDNSFHFGDLVLDGASSIVVLQAATGSFVTATLPITLAAGDTLRVSIDYMR